jgi:hypothetical protein
MIEENPCKVCGKSTFQFLFDDRKLRIPICSYECEQKYLDTVNYKEKAELLGRFDNRIAKEKHDLRLCWAAAGVGALVVLLGFLLKAAPAFIAGASLATVCAFLTRYLEEKITKLTQNRKRVSV